MIGLVLGKFYPPHKGHLFLIETAEQAVDRLYVVVGSSKGQVPSGPLRVQWLQRLVKPTTIVVDIPDNNPDHVVPYSDGEFWDIWKDNLLRNLAEKPDILFGSEDYVVKLAETMGIHYAIIDKERLAVPISATQIRENPTKHWDFMPEVVQKYYSVHLDKSEEV